MPPQDTNWYDWGHLLYDAILGAVGVAAGLMKGAWKLARIESDIRKDFDDSLDAIGSDFDKRHNDIVSKISGLELDIQKNFVAKSDFEDFRREYREDMRDLKKAIADMRPAARGH